MTNREALEFIKEQFKLKYTAKEINTASKLIDAFNTLEVLVESSEC